jgi:hypothetical protein
MFYEKNSYCINDSKGRVFGWHLWSPIAFPSEFMVTCDPWIHKCQKVFQPSFKQLKWYFFYLLGILVDVLLLVKFIYGN